LDCLEKRGNALERGGKRGEFRGKGDKKGTMGRKDVAHLRQAIVEALASHPEG